MLNAAILIAVIAVGGLLAWPKLSNNKLWRATLTPLASIIGSGFLVLGPILDDKFGQYGLIVMALLCAIATAFGSAIRFNITARSSEEGEEGPILSRLEHAASWVLAFAYIISVAYYLNLFGAFGVSLTPVDDNTTARLLTTAVFGLILLVGWTRGFSALERLEELSVGIKLSIIAGLLVALAVYFTGKATSSELVLNPPTVSGWGAATLIFGLIVTVQGFETSRYLGATYSPAMRVRSMQLAQLISAIIYLIYIGFVTFVFSRDELQFSETAIVDMMGVVAPILPVLLVAAALSAQLSAAVADTNGSGGLFEELTEGRVSSRMGYLLLVAVGVSITWLADVFQIISYASRAFALYYAIQSAIAARAAWKAHGWGPRCLVYGALAGLGLAMALFGAAVEG